MNSSLNWFNIVIFAFSIISILALLIMMIVSFNKKRGYGKAATTAGFAFMMLATLQIWNFAFSHFINQFVGAGSVMVYFVVNNVFVTFAYLFTYWLFYKAIFIDRAAALPADSHLNDGTPLADLVDGNPYASPRQ